VDSAEVAVSAPLSRRSYADDAPGGSPAPRPATHALFREIGAERAAAVRARLSTLTPADRRRRLRDDWGRLLGDIVPHPGCSVATHSVETHPGFLAERILLAVEPTIRVPLLLLQPDAKRVTRRMVVAVAQEGKAAFLRQRAGEIAALLADGCAVCLPDVRGTGETSPGPSRERQSPATSLSATEWMLGQTLLGARLRDLRAVLGYVKSRFPGPPRFPFPLVLWGNSFAPVNPAGFADPILGEGEAPPHSEPLGGLLALFGALYEEGVSAVIARGMLAGYLSVLEELFCYVPHDAIVPGALTAGDLCDVAAALAPLPLLLEGLVDGRNCRVPAAELERIFAPTREAYGGLEERLRLSEEPCGQPAEWLDRVLD
jgi:hypothetical protein